MLHCEIRWFMERICLKLFRTFPLLSVVQWQSLTAALVIKTSVENAIASVVWGEGCRGFGRSKTAVTGMFTNVVLWLGGLRCVIGLARSRWVGLMSVRVYGGGYQGRSVVGTGIWKLMALMICITVDSHVSPFIRKIQWKCWLCHL